MSAASRALQVGDWVVTDYGVLQGRPLRRAQIVARREGANSQSRIMFQTAPSLDPYSRAVWLDADWFEPAPKE